MAAVKIPRIFLGTWRRVASECEKIVSQLARDASLEDAIENCEMLDLDEYREHLICMRADRGDLGGEHFRIGQLSDVLIEGLGPNVGRLDAIREGSVDFLAASAW